MVFFQKPGPRLSYTYMKADEELLKLCCMFALVQNLAGCCRAIERVSEEGRGFFFLSGMQGCFEIFILSSSSWTALRRCAGYFV